MHYLFSAYAPYYKDILEFRDSWILTCKKMRKGMVLDSWNKKDFAYYLFIFWNWQIFIHFNIFLKHLPQVNEHCVIGPRYLLVMGRISGRHILPDT